MKYDILIVGGGPAGSLAGAQLIGSGLRVAILDRARFPRIKPCGGGISRRFYRRFSYVEPVLRSVPTNFVTKVVFESPSGEVVQFESDDPLYAMIRRIEFDEALLNHCRQNGIEVLENVTVGNLELTPDGAHVYSTSGEEFVSDLVIGADGVNSIIAVKSGLRGPWKPTEIAIDGTEESPLTDLQVNQDTMYVYYGMGGGFGYGYIFPKRHHVNFGVGNSLDYFKKYIREQPYVRHQSFLEQLKQSGVITGHSQRANFHAYVLPVGGPLRRVSSDRVLLAGDAAGFVNGFTAEGIYYAMLTGEHAGQTALQAIKNKNISAIFLKRHDEACEAEAGLELRKSVAIQKRLFANPRLIDSVVRFASRSNSARDLLTRFGIGEITYRQFKKRALVEALPAYLLYQTEKLGQRLIRA